MTLRDLGPPASIPFLITGLPRSRTAWLATAANTVRNCRCWHEPLQWLDKWEDVVPEIWERPGASYIGISDHALGFHLEALLEQLSLRVLVVERPQEEVEASLQKLGLPAGKYCQLLSDRLSYQHPLICRISFSQLHRTSVVVEVLEWLMPGAEVDPTRIEALQYLNVQVHLPKLLRGAANLAARADTLLGVDVMAELRKVHSQMMGDLELLTCPSSVASH